MKVEGGCYCKAIRYEAEGNPIFALQCHCRECQYLSGGAPNMTMALPEAGFRYTKGKPKAFARKDLEKPVTREFCGECGTQLTSRSPNAPGGVMLKVGTFDDPTQFSPQVAIYLCDKQPFHQVPPGMPTFERLPG